MYYIPPPTGFLCTTVPVLSNWLAGLPLGDRETIGLGPVILRCGDVTADVGWRFWAEGRGDGEGEYCDMLVKGKANSDE
jgi:hypothetical protein